MTCRKQDKHEEGINTFQSEDLKERYNFGDVSVQGRKMKSTFKILGFEGMDCTQRCEISRSRAGEQDVTPCSLFEICRYFGVIYFPILTIT
jgi:hypothetical protein